jgi:hypothetical protein
MKKPSKSPEPTALGAVSSAVAVHVTSRRWLSFTLDYSLMKKISHPFHQTGLLLLFCGLCAAINPVSAQIWTPTGAPTNYWNSIASSADGAKLVAAVYAGGIYTSTNSGTTWTLTSAPSDGGVDSAWESVASSADGSKLVAAGFYFNPIYLSTNGGANWSTNGPSGDWQSVACSSDGNKIVAVAYFNEPIFTSTNSGANWIQATNAPNGWWQSVACSADGTKFVVAAGGIGGGPGPIYISTNSGADWAEAFAPNQEWMSVASSADGTKFVAAANSGQIYTSSDSGMRWGQVQVPSEPWSSVASSADGTKLIGVAYNLSCSSSSPCTYSGGIFTSTNSGLGWTQTIGPSNYWLSVATSADGNKSVVTVSDGGIYGSQTIQSPQLNLAASTNDLCLSWLIPSTSFALQLNSNLTTTNWVSLTNVPMLNPITLQYVVTLSPTNSSGFYRLATPRF